MVRAAEYAISMAVSIVPPSRSFEPSSLSSISRLLGAPLNQLSEGRKTWDNYVDSGVLALVIRGNLRSDRIPNSWADFAATSWLHEDITRASENTYDSLRNPHDHSDTQIYRIHWLEQKIEDVVDKINSMGRVKFPDNFEYDDGIPRKFHLSWKVVVALRHFSVKDASFDACLCRYHWLGGINVELCSLPVLNRRHLSVVVVPTHGILTRCEGGLFVDRKVH
jgi:hypothetical protein